MKKLLSLFLVLVLIAGFFTACKNSEANLSTTVFTEIKNSGLQNDYSLEFEEGHKYVQRLLYAEKQDYENCLSILSDAGFKKHTENQIGDNLFATLYNKVTTISLSYMPGNASVRIVAEPRGELFTREQDNKYKSKNIQTLFTGMQCDNMSGYSGLGFIIRLDDGSFIIIDGGQGDPYSVDSNNLMNILREQSPEGTKKPVIAAWIITHNHSDHTGVFNTFATDFHDQVEIEKIYYNFPKDEEQYYKPSESLYGFARFRECLSEYYANVPVIKPHTGDKYYIRNAVVEMLFSYEDLYPLSFNTGTLSELNDSSLVFTIDVAGQRIMITGDADTRGMNQVVQCFGDYLKSDILQMSHHGQNGTVDFYTKVDPTYALLPMSHFEISRLEANDANKWLVNSDNVRQFIEFSKHNVTFALPYNPSDSEIQRIPDWSTTYPTYPSLKVEAVKSADKLPEAWFDLGFKDGKPYDKTSNLTVTMTKGTIGKTTVNYNGNKYDVTAFTGDSAKEGLLVNLPFKNANDYSKWLMDGATFELLVQINKQASEDAPLFANTNVGGVGILSRNQEGTGQVQFALGSTDANSALNKLDSFALAARKWPNEGPAYLSEKQLVHLVATYDKKANKLSIYYDGKHASSGAFGKGEFNLGNAGFNALGIGINPSNNAESFGKTGSFTVLGAKLYKTAFNEAQALKAYNDCISEFTK
ncbi:MAG: MBL fold metallo-hydrolase [Clostridia bacterium]|nr:MBL fold metallo-hydrolase [Clostridia bacterium]